MAKEKDQNYFDPCEACWQLPDEATTFCRSCQHNKAVIERLLAEVAKLTKKAKGTPKAEGDIDFENFWMCFPKLRRVKKVKAATAYKRAVDRIMHDKDCSRGWAVSFLQEAIAEYAMSAQGKGRFCPGPEPWLNGGRWDDDREAWQYESNEDMPKGSAVSSSKASLPKLK